MKIPVEYYEAQYRPVGSETWYRLGGRTLDGARKAIAMSRNSNRVAKQLFGEGEGDKVEYRIFHVIGVAEEIEA
jgi:hypothetical protein